MIVCVLLQVLLNNRVYSYQHPRPQRKQQHKQSPHNDYNDGPRLTARELLTHNPLIKVPLGRSYSLDPMQDLAIQVRPGDRCTVKVLGDTDRLMMRPGRFQPSSFPCRYLPDSVTYTHLGARSPGEDRVRLQVSNSP